MRFRPTVQQRLVPASVGALGAVIAFEVLLWTNGEPLLQHDSLSAGLAALVLPLGSLWLQRDHGVELTRRGVTVRGARRRTVDWDGIRDIRIEGQSVALYRTDGGRMLLRAPHALLDRAFAEKVAVMDGWWRQYRRD
ncbi:hypothetical protein [Kitasatospora sp. NPDC059571]|uniref:hypothetical protein n=1 Tax=Kitasatospora sp. NPDC059571 TaxID=3346871 RepID=UPI0036786FE2